MKSELFGPVRHERYKNYIVMIHDSAVYLHQLICDLLDVSRIETGNFSLHDEKDVSLRDIVTDAVSTVCGAHPQLRVVVTPADESKPLLATIDPVRMKQVFVNILGNAAKFSPPDIPVLVDISRTDVGGASVRIADRGPGMPRDQIKRATVAFEQLSQDASTGRIGLGLGLAISKDVMLAHGGELTIQSALTVGTVVGINLPPERVAAPAVDPAVDAPMPDTPMRSLEWPADSVTQTQIKPAAIANA